MSFAIDPPNDKAIKAKKRLPLVLLVGPTAVGKTRFAIELAQRLDAEIISLDSRTFYRGMDIGTAKPSHEERMRVPHHLVDVVDPDETWSLAVVLYEVYRAINEVHQRNRLPLLVGGSGQYVRAILRGWQAPPVPPNLALRRELELWAQEIGKEALHARLYELDAEAAEKIDPRNLRRTIRALEVIFSTGKPFSQQRNRVEWPFRICVLGLTLPRAELFRRIDARIEEMLAQGWVEEVSHLLSKGYTPDLPSFSAIGYQEIAEHLQGKLTLDEARQLIQRKTRVFVRRQANWFKPSDPNIHWFVAQEDALSKMESFILHWMDQAE